MAKTFISSTPYDIYYAVAHRSEQEIKSFASRYDDFDENLIPRIFEQALGKKVVAHRRSTSWGSSHVIYFVTLDGYKEELVLRANTGINPEPEGVMEVERLITKQVAGLGLVTNEIIYADISRQHFPFDFQIQKKLRGRDPEVSFDGTQKDYDRLSYQLGEYVAKYHSLEYPLFGRFDLKAAQQGKLQGTKNNFFAYLETCLADDLQKLVDFAVIGAKDFDRLLAFFTKRRELINSAKGVLNHHDLADHNLMYDERGLVGVFDWEAAVIGDPVLDLASCPTWRTLYPREAELLAGYQSVRSLPDNFAEKKNVYFLRTMIWKMVYAIRMNILTSERKQRFVEAMKIID
jgi:aminoglycoside phosphotransferase (APT) family kinase protein